MPPVNEQALFAPLPPPEGLFDRISETVNNARLRTIRRRMLSALSGLLLSIAFLVVYWPAFWTEIRRSSIDTYLQLAFTDTDIALREFSDFLFGMLESLPSGSLLALLTTAFLLLLTIGSFHSFHHLKRQPPIH